MNKLIQSNIRRSFKIAAEENPTVSDNLVEVVNEDPGGEIIPFLSEKLAKDALQPIPWFYRNSSRELQSPQQSFFGLYLIRNVIRGIFLGLRFIQAGDLLRHKHFLAVSVFCYYTSSFHLLNSFLALHGRVIIEEVLGPAKVVKSRGSASLSFGSLEPTPSVIIAALTRANTWKFESRSRSHGRRWKELEPILLKSGKKIPDFFLDFFKYLVTYREDALLDLESLIRKGLQRLTETRHESIYRGYGDDDYVHYGLLNRDLFSAHGIDQKSNAYRDFAIGFLNFSAKGLIELKKVIPNQHWSKARVTLAASVFMPSFEVENFVLEGEPELTEILDQIYTWVLKHEEA